MKTKLVYVLISTETDVYYEQTLISVWSAKYWNPTAKVVVVVDDETKATLRNNRKELENIVDEIVVTDLSNPDKYPQGKTKVQKSRILKTNLRNFIEGDYLYIDTDTVICGDLSEIDGWAFPIGMVWDGHKKFDKKANYDVIQRANIIGEDVSSASEYYNGGVMFVKDLPETRDFCGRWYNLCMKAQSLGSNTDQPPLLACQVKTPLIKQIDGIYNCQFLSGGLPFFANAKILHYYICMGYHSFYLFDDKDFLLSIKKDGKITEKTASLILSAKEQFYGDYVLMYDRNMEYVRSNIFHIFVDSPKKFHFLEFIGKILRKI